jgi:hypothetical protein
MHCAHGSVANASSSAGISSNATAVLTAGASVAANSEETSGGAADTLSASANSTDETAGDFVSVPYTEGIGPDDEAMVVRVQLTRESLAQLGFPVDEVHGSDWVRADVLVGQDGWPRGVRLVQ